LVSVSARLCVPNHVYASPAHETFDLLQRRELPIERRRSVGLELKREALCKQIRKRQADHGLQAMLVDDATVGELLDTSEVKRRFAEHGVPVQRWALERGFSPGLVYEVLKGRRRCLRGESHRIAIALKLKPRPTCPLP
jgi:gp16 family phage-associated protein